MLLTGRQAARLLTFPPTSLTTRSARYVLACGLAGDPRMGGSTWLYDDDAIVALKKRRTVSAQECRRRFPGGIFVSRRRIDARWPAERRRAAVAESWPIGLATQLVIAVRVIQDGSLPMISTVGGFVVDGFDITDVAVRDDGGHDFILAQPGAWFDDLRDARVPTGPGREWTMPGWEAPRKHRIGTAP